MCVCVEASASILHLHLNQFVSVVEFDRHMLLVVISRAFKVKSKLTNKCDFSPQLSFAIRWKKASIRTFVVNMCPCVFFIRLWTCLNTANCVDRRMIHSLKCTPLCMSVLRSTLLQWMSVPVPLQYFYPSYVFLRCDYSSFASRSGTVADDYFKRTSFSCCFFFQSKKEMDTDWKGVTKIKSNTMLKYA